MSQRTDYGRQAGLWLLAAALAAPAGAQQPRREQREQGRGPGRAMAEIHEPRFVPAVQANFLGSDARVIGVSEGGVAKAYSAPVLAWHHIVQDRLGKLPILVTW